MAEGGWTRPAMQFCFNCGLPIFDFDPTSLCMPCSDELRAGYPKGSPDAWPRAWRMSTWRALACAFPAPRSPLAVDMPRLVKLAKDVYHGRLTGDGEPMIGSSVFTNED